MTAKTGPSQSMVEKMARAIYEGRLGGGNWDLLLTQRRWKYTADQYRRQARAALEAMRTPTEGMYEALSNSDKMWKEQNSTTVWQTFIDAALSEGK